MRKPQWIKNIDKDHEEVKALNLTGDGVCEECGKPYNSEWHQGKTCFNGPFEVA